MLKADLFLLSAFFRRNTLRQTNVLLHRFVAQQYFLYLALVLKRITIFITKALSRQLPCNT